MDRKNKSTRLAGLLYLIIVLTGIFDLMYVPSKLIVWDNPVLTLDNIENSEFLFRLGIIAGIICYTTFLFLPVVLYRLLNVVNKTIAIWMVVLSVFSVPFSLYNLLNKVNVLTLLERPDYLQLLNSDSLHAAVMLHLDYYYNGIQIISIFWGLWLLPFGYLVFKSGFLPKVLGVLLMIGCFGYLTNFFGGFLFENYGNLGIRRFVSLPASIGEIGICLWMLVMGAKTKRNQ
ncbi:MAG: DUF4386 domain-containing protein [Bacteroidota bacterium]